MTDNVAYLPPVPPAPEAMPPVPAAPHPLTAQLERCRPFLEPAILDGTPWAEIVSAVMAGKAQLWPGDAAAMVTQVLEEKQGRALHVWLGGGEMTDLLALQPAVAAWGRSMGCNHATIEGRQGWGKMLKANGWAASFTVFSRPL